jgi:hypothetical protein
VLLAEVVLELACGLLSLYWTARSFRTKEMVYLIEHPIPRFTINPTFLSGRMIFYIECSTQIF